MHKKEESAKRKVNIGTLFHKEHSKKTLVNAIQKVLYDDEVLEDIRNRKSTKENIEEAKLYIKPETLKIWDEFSKEYEFFYSGLFIKRLVTVLKFLHEGKTIEEIAENLQSLPLNKTLINYICIALIRFSDRGFEFYEKLYIMDITEDENVIINEYETAMCRLLTKKDKNK